MNGKNKKIRCNGKLKEIFLFGFALLTICALEILALTTQPVQAAEKLEITPNFVGCEIAANERIELKLNRAFQDNRQPGRERADFLSLANALTLNIKAHTALDLDFDLAQESQKNFEQPRTDRTFRLGTRSVWRTPFLKNSNFSSGFSVTLAGDSNNLGDSRNPEFDAQWDYQFSFGKEKFKKLSAQFFIRYANRYGDTIDRQFFVNNFNKAQTFNMGLTFNFF